MSGKDIGPGVQLIQKQVHEFDPTTQFNNEREGDVSRRPTLSVAFAIGGSAFALYSGYKVAQTIINPDVAVASSTPTPIYSGDCPSPYAGNTTYSNPADNTNEPFIPGKADLGVYPSVLYQRLAGGKLVLGEYINRQYVCTGEESSIHVGIENFGGESVPSAELDITALTSESGIVVDGVTTDDNRVATPVKVETSSASSAKYNLGNITRGTEPYYDIQFHTTKAAPNQQLGIHVSNGNSVISNPDGTSSPLEDPNLANNDSVYIFNSNSIGSTQYQGVAKISKPVLFAQERRKNCEASAIAIKVPKDSGTVNGLSYRLSSKTAVFSTSVHQKLKHNMLVKFGNINPGKFAVDSFMACFKSIKKPSTAKLTTQAKNVPTANYQAIFRATNSIKGGRWVVRSSANSKSR